MFDVIVVGAGIAGAAAALFLRQAGMTVLVLEREALPHAKTCGGGVPYSVLRRFPFDPAEGIEQEIRSVRMSCGKRTVAHDIPPRTVATVRRERLDARVLQAASAEVRDRCPVSEIVERDNSVLVRADSGESWEGRWLLAADGCSSTVARCLDLHPHHLLVPAVEARIPMEQRTKISCTQVEFAFGRLYGYTWSFPKCDHLSVGAVAFRRGPASLRTTLEEYLAARGLALGGAQVLAHPLPIYRSASPLHATRTLLLGDAAGLVDPLLGEGIRYAVQTARIAADVILADGPAAAYTERVQATIGPSLRRAGQLAWFVYHWPRLAWELVLSHPDVVKEMVGVFDERQDYVSLSHQLPRLAVESLSRRGR